VVDLRLPVMYNQLDFFCKLQIILTLEGTQHFVVFHCKKIFSRFVITTYFLLSNQLYNNLFS